MPAPREIRPGETMRPQSDIVPELVGRGTRFERELSAALASRRVRLTHPYFGVITGVQALDYCSVHLEHHRRQLPGV